MRRQMGQYLFFVCANQFLVLPVFQLAWSFGDGQRRVEDEQLSSTVCSLRQTDQPSAFTFYTQAIMVYYVINNLESNYTIRFELLAL